MIGWTTWTEREIAAPLQPPRLALALRLRLQLSPNPRKNKPKPNPNPRPLPRLLPSKFPLLKPRRKPILALLYVSLI